MSPDVAPSDERSGLVAGTRVVYDAFLSYSRKDTEVAVGVQRGLHTIGRRPGRLHALRVFRDQTDMEVSPDLWGKVTDAMDRSRYFILMLSPHAATSEWVDKEVTYWLEHRGHDRLLLVLANGRLDWDEDSGRFDPDGSDAAPPALLEPGVLGTLPGYVDVSGDSPWDPRSPVFRDNVTELAAPIHGKSKYDLTSDDLREQRRYRRLRFAAIGGLAVLTATAVAAALFAVDKQQDAVRERNRAEAVRVTAQGQAMLSGFEGGGDIRALQQILAGNQLLSADGGGDVGALFTAVIERLDTLKIIKSSPELRTIAVDPDDRYIAAGDGSTVRLWDANTGLPEGTPMLGHEGRVVSVALSPDGAQLVSASVDSIRVWDLTTRREIGAPIRTRPDPGKEFPPPPSTLELRIDGTPTSAAVSPDGRNVVIGSSSGAVQVWNLSTLEPVGSPLRGHTAPVTSVAFNPNGRFIVSGSADNTVRVWDSATLVPVGVPLVGHVDAVTSVAVSPDGRLIASGSADHTVRVWDVFTGRPIEDITGHTNVVTSVAFSTDGTRLVSGSYDNTVRVWDVDTGAAVGQPLTGHQGQVESVQFSSNGGGVVSASVDGTIRVWHLAASGPAGGRDAGSSPVGASSPDGRFVASGMADGGVQLWHADTGDAIGVPMVGPSRKPVRALAFSVDGRRVIAGHEDGALQVWDTETAELTSQATTAKPVLALAFSEDGSRIASGGSDAVVRLWDTDGLRPVGVSTPVGTVTSVAVSPSGQRVVSGTSEGTVSVWNGDDLRLAGREMTGHTATVTDVAFSPDGNRVISNSEDGTIRLWDVASARPIGDPMPSDDTLVSTVSFGPDGRPDVPSASATLQLWPAPPVSAWPGLVCAKIAQNTSNREWREWITVDKPYEEVCPGLPRPPEP